MSVISVRVTKESQILYFTKKTLLRKFLSTQSSISEVKIEMMECRSTVISYC